jgi:hypothetical protein
MGQQERVIACGAGLTALGMALRFVAGPLATLVGAAALGLRGDVLHLAIIQVHLLNFALLGTQTVHVTSPALFAVYLDTCRGK